ncbi:uncharacterized histidine-rich protein DDB_G0274557-like, partial [Anopheles moucheti]|uniref:uncharacterized histidine-rich protein DDB_G0274557-like n=1 Tax=Anopheles moucheti TaxID=186751 RepID=UPI0022F11AF8
LKTSGGTGAGAGGNRGTDGSSCYLDDNSNHVVVISDADGNNSAESPNNSVANFTHKLHQHLHSHGGAHQYHHHLQQQHQQQQQQQHSSQLLHPFYNQHHQQHHHLVQHQHHHQHLHHQQAGSSNSSNHGYSSQPASPYHNHNSNSSEPKHLQGSHSPSPGVTPAPSGTMDAQSQAMSMQQHY